MPPLGIGREQMASTMSISTFRMAYPLEVTALDLRDYPLSIAHQQVDGRATHQALSGEIPPAGNQSLAHEVHCFWQRSNIPHWDLFDPQFASETPHILPLEPPWTDANIEEDEVRGVPIDPTLLDALTIAFAVEAYGRRPILGGRAKGRYHLLSRKHLCQSIQQGDIELRLVRPSAKGHALAIPHDSDVGIVDQDVLGKVIVVASYFDIELLGPRSRRSTN